VIQVSDSIADRFLSFIKPEQNIVVAYGYQHHGRCLEKVLCMMGLQFEIVDDYHTDCKRLEDLDSKKEYTVVLCASDEKVRARMCEKAIKLGFSNIIDNKSLLVFLEETNRYNGYESAVRTNISKNACPICESDAYEIYVNIRKLRVKKCTDCEHEFIDEVSKEVVTGFYDDIRYFEKNYNISIDDFFNESFMEFCKTRMSMVSPFLTNDIKDKKGGAFLEIGCLDGRFLWYLKEQGFDVVGCEINKSVAQVGIENLGVDIRCMAIEECNFEDESFDIIFSSHVLEHLVDPLSIVKISREKLKHGGKFIANLPCNETDYENPHHLHFFSNKSILKAMESVFDEISIHHEKFPYLVNGEIFYTITVCGKKN